jgi:hypothetical protein
VAITWHEQPQCELLHESVVLAPQVLCHTVPQGASGGYKITCVSTVQFRLVYCANNVILSLT